MSELGKFVQSVLKGVLALGLVACSAGLPGHAHEYGFSPVSGQVTSPFGWRTDPITGNPRFHGGVDIGAPTGTPVYTPQAGYVVYSGSYGGYGNVVVLNHGNSLYTLYGHNSQLLVKAGQSVYRGQAISLVGSTGRSTGPHLHFEVHYNQQYVNPITYLSYLQQASPMLAQVPSGAKKVAVIQGGSTAKSVSVVNRASSSRKRAHKGRTVQVVSGTDVEMIEF